MAPNTEHELHELLITKTRERLAYGVTRVFKSPRDPFTECKRVLMFDLNGTIRSGQKSHL